MNKVAEQIKMLPRDWRLIDGWDLQMFLLPLEHYDKKWVMNFASNFYGLIKASKTFPENNYQIGPENN